MDDQILQQERGTAAGQIARGILFAVVMGAFGAFMIGRGLELPIVTIALIVLAIELIIIIIAVIVEAKTPFVSRGPRAIGQVYTMAPAQLVAGTLQNGLMHEKFQPGGWQGTTLYATKKMSAWSWG